MFEHSEWKTANDENEAAKNSLVNEAVKIK